MSLHEQKYCPRCHSIFECKAGTILLCQCNKIILDERVRNYLTLNYNDCLCVGCLEEIKTILKTVSAREDYFN